MVHLTAQGKDGFKVDGEMSFTTVPGLWKQSQRMFVTRAEQGLNIDLGSVHRFDSAGLALLVAWSRWARRHSVPIRFIDMPKKLSAVVRANHLEALFGLAAEH
jgi:phospholipid transport system transporter-binding protein